VVNDQTAHVVPVKTIAAHGSLVEVEGDLKPGLKVVVRGNERLRPGQPVQIVPDFNSGKTPSHTGKNPPTSSSTPSNTDHETD
jgi:hypothetical protein